MENLTVLTLNPIKWSGFPMSNFVANDNQTEELVKLCFKIISVSVNILFWQVIYINYI